MFVKAAEDVVGYLTGSTSTSVVIQVAIVTPR